MKFPPIRDLHPPAGSPNILVILIDDVAVLFPVEIMTNVAVG